MSVALYRKYRPGTFGEVRGQEHVTEPLRQALRNGRINHAYLFSGPRGCGKTTSARILARSLNCANGPTPDPCGECDSCVALAPDGSGSVDVIEIDAASHGGVDDARELRERAFFAPVSSRYKVYIIDESHMVTREGFNALLKLVEEPPPHLKFIFATTEPDKVISTIRSRTHHYPFRLIPPSTLRELMEEILTSEGIDYDPAALALVVRAGAGSARDTLSVLDQLLAGSGEQGITREDAVSLLGYTDSSLLAEMVDALGSQDGAAAFELIDRVIEGGHDPRRFAADLLERVRDLVVLTAVPDALDKGLINVSPDAVERMREQADRIGGAALTRAADILNTGLTEMRGATAPRLLLELICARILLPAASGQAAPPAAQTPPQPRPAAEAPRPARSAPAEPPRPQPAPDPAPPPPPAQPVAQPPASAPTPPPPPAGQTAANGDSASVQTIRDAWPRILEAIKARRRFTWMILTGSDAQVLRIEGKALQLGFQRANDAKGFSTSGSDQIVREALKEVVQLDLHVVAAPVSGGGDAAPPAPPSPAPAPPRTTPAPAADIPEPPASADVEEEVDFAPAETPASEVETAEEPAPEAAEPDPPRRAEEPAPAANSGAGPLALIQGELGGRIIEEINHSSGEPG